MAKNNELITKIILKGVSDPSLSKAFKNAENLSNNGLNSLKKFGETAKKVAKAAGVAVVAGLGASAKAAIDYESAFAGVMKTVDETGTTSYEDLSKSIRQMSKEMPASATEIAAVAETAGQLGIKADDIANFSKTMINLGETTNLSSEDAASAIAKFFNITNTGMGDVENFGSTLVALGNNAATTESDIMNMASRIAASGNMIGLSNQDILALATSLSSVGLEAEGGGTAISTVLSQIDKSVATNGKTLSTWANLAGLSVKDFKTAWQTNAMGTIQKVIGGMGDAQKGGKNLNVILDELGITGIRTSDTMKRLTNASGLMGDMVNLSNKAWDENVALANEANVRYNTMASKIQIFKNKLVDVAITVGDKLMPIMDKVLAKMDQIDWESVGTKICNAIQWVCDNASKLLPIIGAIGGAVAGFKIAGIIEGIMTAVKVISILIKSFGLMKVALGLLGGPVGIAIVVIGLLIGAFIGLWLKSEKFRNFWKGLWQSIKDIASKVGSWLKNFLGVTIPNAISAMVEWFKSLPSKIGGFFSNMYNSAVKWVGNMVNSIVNWFKQLPSRIGTWLTGVVTKINTWRTNMIAKAKSVGTSFVNAVVNFFQALPYKVGYFIGMCAGKVATWGVKLWQFATVKIPQFINAVVNWFKQLPSRIWTWLVNTVQKINAWGTRMVTIGRQKAMQFINAVINFFRTLPSKIWAVLVNAVNRIIAWGTRIVTVGRQKATQFVSAVVTFIRTLPAKIWAVLLNAVNRIISWGTQLAAKGRAAAQKLSDAIVNKVKEIPDKMLSIGKNIVDGLWNGIIGAKDRLVSKVSEFCNGVISGFEKNFKINSPSLVMEKLGKFLPMGLGNGIVANTKYAVNAVKTMGGRIMEQASSIKPTISTKVAAVGNKIKAFANGGTVTRPQTAIVGDAPETIVPHGNTPRNRALLNEAAKGVGANSGRNNINFTFAPTINGNAHAEENRKMLQEEEAEFERKMDAYLAKRGRLAF